MTTEEKAEMWRKFTIEQKADVYQLRIANRYQAKMNVSTTILEEEVKHAYLAGAAEALRSQWKDASKELPEEDEYCIILGPCGMQAACWNSHYQSWDDEQGDDHLYDKEQVTHWLSIPEIPDTQEP